MLDGIAAQCSASVTLHYLKAPTLSMTLLPDQIGESEEDHKRCLRAELDNVTPRTVYTVDRRRPGSDACAVAAAALAAASMALRKLSNKEGLANTCLRHARKLYAVGGEMRANYSDSIPECAKTYPTDKWQQFMMLGAAWLYRASGDGKYRKVSSCPDTAVHGFGCSAQVTCEQATLFQQALGPVLLTARCTGLL